MVRYANSHEGLMVSQLFPALIVSQPEDIKSLAYYFVILTAVPLVLTVLFFKDKPPSPPSISVSARMVSDSGNCNNLVFTKLIVF